MGRRRTCVVLLHGHPETATRGGRWRRRSPSHTVIVPDLRGIGRSSRPSGGYDQVTQAADIRAVVDFWGPTAPRWSGTTRRHRRLCLCRALSRRSPAGRHGCADSRRRAVGGAQADPLLWHLYFGGPDAERLVEVGSGSISTTSGTTLPAIHQGRRGPRNFYASIRVPWGDARRIRPTRVRSRMSRRTGFRSTKLTIPVLAVGGERRLARRWASSCATRRRHRRGGRCRPRHRPLADGGKSHILRRPDPRLPERTRAAVRCWIWRFATSRLRPP